MSLIVIYVQAVWKATKIIWYEKKMIPLTDEENKSYNK